MASRSEPAPTGWDSRITSGEGLLVSVFVHGSSFQRSVVVACGWCGGRGDTRVIKVRGRAYTRPHAVVARAGSHIAGDGGVSRTFHVCCCFFLLVTVRLMRRLQRCLAS